MKNHIFLALAFFCAVGALAQTRTINNPKYGARTSTLNRVTKVELTDTSTNVYFRVDFSPSWSVVISDKSYIQVSSGGDKLAMRSYKGIPVGLNANWTIPKSGYVEYSMSYPKVEASVEKIDFMDDGGGGGSWNIFDIELKPESVKRILPDALMGNWLKTDGSNVWVAGFYDKVAIYNNTVWDYGNVEPNGKAFGVTLAKGSQTVSLVLEPTEKGKLSIGLPNNDVIVCSKTKQPKGQYNAQNSGGSVAFLQSGNAVLRGYINGYSEKMGFKTGQLDLPNVVADKNEEFSFGIHPNGTFEVTVPMASATNGQLYLYKTPQPIFLEPGSVTTVCVQMDELVEYHRHYQSWIKGQRNNLFMGPCSDINIALAATDTIRYMRKELDKVLPMWVKITRNGNLLSTFSSFNGKDWRPIADAVSVDLGPKALAGLCVTAHNNRAVCKARFSNVSVSQVAVKPNGFKVADIGKVGVKGKFKAVDNGFELGGSGADIWGNADAFRFAYLPFTGDGEVVARIDNYNETDGVLKIGVMVRENLSAGARYAMASFSPAYGALAQWRPESDGGSSHVNHRFYRINQMSLADYAEMLKQVQSQEGAALEQLAARMAISPRAMDYMKRQQSLRRVSELASFNNLKDNYYRWENNIGYDQMHVPVLKEYLDKTSTDMVSQCLNNAEGIHHREYWNLLMRVKYSSTFDYGPRTVPTLSNYFDLMGELGVVYTQAETEWKTLMVDFENTPPHQRDTAAYSLAMGKYSDVSTLFFEKYREQSKVANLLQSVRFGNFPQIKQTLACQPWVDDLFLMHRLMHEINEYRIFSDRELSMASSFLSTNGFSDILRNANTQMMATIELNKAKTGFIVHEAPKVGDELLFGAILEPFKGKLVYVDFWATWCSPCRSGIARIAPLKEELDGKEIEFVYITGETSPLVTWQNSIPDIKGHHYRLTNAQWRYLCNKYNITGIPRYMLVGKDGQIINPELPHLDNEGIRNMLIQNM